MSAAAKELAPEKRVARPRLVSKGSFGPFRAEGVGWGDTCAHESARGLNSHCAVDYPPLSAPENSSRRARSGSKKTAG